jgi:hypothetical protein
MLDVMVAAAEPHSAQQRRRKRHGRKSYETHTRASTRHS